MKKIIVISCLITSILFFNSNSNPELILLEHMTTYDDNKVSQVCLVKNPPANSQTLYQLIQEFNQKNKIDTALSYTLFIKEHDYEFPLLPFAKNIDYSLETTPTSDLDNIDFLGYSQTSKNSKGILSSTTEVYTGYLYYYKN